MGMLCADKIPSRTICLFSFAFALIVADHAFAELFHYIDNEKIAHLTTDPQNAPTGASVRSALSAGLPATPQDLAIIEFVMNRHGIGNDLPIMNDEDLEKTVLFLRELLRQNVVDPEELDKPLDPRLATPDGTVTLFRSALRSGNILELKKCVINSYWNQMGEEFQVMGTKKLADMEKEMFFQAVIEKISQSDSEANFELVRSEGSKTYSYNLNLINVFGNWKIETF